MPILLPLCHEKRWHKPARSHSSPIGINLKLNDVEPLGYLADVLTKIVDGHPNSQF
jgi:hypothetical protein